MSELLSVSPSKVVDGRTLSEFLDDCVSGEVDEDIDLSKYPDFWEWVLTEQPTRIMQ